MNLFDIIGPVMVGPSSSHTAGACRLGQAARRLLQEPPVSAEILLHGSFATTGRGHGTDKAIAAGLLGMAVDDPRLPRSFQLAEEQGLSIRIGTIDLGSSAHPNSVLLNLTGASGKKMQIIGASVGGGQIQIRSINGMKTVFSCLYPTLIVQNTDTPGSVAAVSQLLAAHGINVATIQLNRENRGGSAVCVYELDQEVSPALRQQLASSPTIQKLLYYSPNGK
jgi:L-serine dehydratase